MTSINQFSALNNTDDIPSPSITSTPAPPPSPILTLAPFRRSNAFSGKNWADMVDDDVQDFDINGQPIIETSINPPTFKKDTEHIRKEEQQTNQTHNQILNKLLSKKSEITVGRFSNRKLRVISQEAYEKLIHLIKCCKSHDKNGRFCRREQEQKIKLSNSLLESTYKVKKQPRFIYSIATIYLGDGRILTRSEVEKGSNAFFEIEERIYEPSSM